MNSARLSEWVCNEHTHKYFKIFQEGRKTPELSCWDCPIWLNPKLENHICSINWKTCVQVRKIIEQVAA